MQGVRLNTLEACQWRKPLTCGYLLTFQNVKYVTRGVTKREKHYKVLQPLREISINTFYIPANKPLTCEKHFTSVPVGYFARNRGRRPKNARSKAQKCKVEGGKCCKARASVLHYGT